MGCCRQLRVQNVDLVAGTSLTFVIEPRDVAPGCTYELNCCVNWGEATGAEVVYIDNDGVVANVLDCIADRARVAELRRCCRDCNGLALRMVYGADSESGDPHYQIRFPQTRYNCCPTFTAAAAPPAQG